jgi:hypothetical protein
MSILPQNALSSIISSGATAAAVLVAVVVFLYGILSSIRQENFEALMRYIQARMKYQSDLHQNLAGTRLLHIYSTLFRHKGGDYDYE